MAETAVNSLHAKCVQIVSESLSSMTVVCLTAGLKADFICTFTHDML